MRFAPEYSASSVLSDKLRAADDMTRELMAEALAVTCRRAPFQGHSAKVLRLNQLAAAYAWTDAALALIELELPFWHVRRIAYDAGEWYCAVSRQRELPDWLDQSIEARHPDLALAILIAFVEAQRATAPRSSTSVPEAFSRPSSNYIRVCCDNFA